MRQIPNRITYRSSNYRVNERDCIGKKCRGRRLFGDGRESTRRKTRAEGRGVDVFSLRNSKTMGQAAGNQIAGLRVHIFVLTISAENDLMICNHV
jgi:hypothetical protein